MISLPKNIRENLSGDRPEIDPSALIDPSAQIIGNVKIGKNVIVGPLTVIRADERGPDGKVKPVVIEEEVHVQDGVIIHTHGGTSVLIGPRTAVAHGVIIHGPCTIGEASFLSMRATLYSASLETSVWVGMGALIMRTNLPARTMVPAGSIIRSVLDTKGLRLISPNEQKYMADVMAAGRGIMDDFRKNTGR